MDPITFRPTPPNPSEYLALFQTTGWVERCRRAGLRDIQLFSSRGRASWYRRRGFRDRPDDAPGMSLTR